MKTLIVFGLILAASFNAFSQAKPQPAKTTTVAPAPAKKTADKPKSDTLSFVYLTTDDGELVLDSSDCYTIKDLSLVKLWVFPTSLITVASLDNMIFADDFVVKPKVATFKYVLSSTIPRVQQYVAMKEAVEKNLRLKLKKPDLRIYLVWPPDLLGAGEQPKMNFVTIK